MKLVDRTLNYFEDFEQKFKIYIKVPELISTLFLSWLIVNHNNSILKLRLNPLGMFSHLGNLVSVPLALIGTYIICFVTFSFFFNQASKAKLFLAASAALVGLAVNLVAETKAGMSLISLPNTGDPLDIFWGVIFCLTACLIVFRVKEI